MSKNLVFGLFTAIVIVGIATLGYIAIERPDATATFAGYLGNFLATVAAFAVTLYGLGKLTEKVESVQRQTNGTLSAKEERIQSLERKLQDNGIPIHDERRKV